MSQAEAVAAGDRLPWLANEAMPRSTYNLREVSGWLIAAALVVGGGAFWLVETGQPNPASEVAPTRTTTVVLPQAQNSPSQSQSKKVVPVHGRRSYSVLAVSHHAAHERTAAEHPNVTAAKAPNVAEAQKKAVVASADTAGSKPGAARGPGSLASSSGRPSSTWPRPALRPSQIHGGVVHVGAFADVQQAKLVWREMVRAYPAVAQFQPSLIENRDWNGRPFYQFQVGTASQADSEMLCQSMERFNFRCAIVGLPWKAQP